MSKSKNLSADKIRSLHPVAGDWYCVYQDHQGERAFIERVTFWALMEHVSLVDHVCAIGQSGLPLTDENGQQDPIFVLGTDLTARGTSWNQEYKDTQVNLLMLRELVGMYGFVSGMTNIRLASSET